MFERQEEVDNKSVIVPEKSEECLTEIVSVNKTLPLETGKNLADLSLAGTPASESRIATMPDLT